MCWKLPELLRSAAITLLLLAVVPVAIAALSGFERGFSSTASVQLIILGGLCYLASVGLETQGKFIYQLPRLIMGAALLNLTYLLATSYAGLMTALLEGIPLPDFPVATAFGPFGTALLFFTVRQGLRGSRQNPPFDG